MTCPRPLPCHSAIPTFDVFRTGPDGRDTATTVTVGWLEGPPPHTGERGVGDPCRLLDVVLTGCHLPLPPLEQLDGTCRTGAGVRHTALFPNLRFSDSPPPPDVLICAPLCSRLLFCATPRTSLQANFFNGWRASLAGRRPQTDYNFCRWCSTTRPSCVVGPGRSCDCLNGVVRWT